MIGVVCLNPALDITHRVAAVDWVGVNRPSAVHARPGGKGLNVARTLHALGSDVLVLGLAGGVTGAGVQTALAGLGVPAHWTTIGGETRRTFTVVDRETGGAALFNEPGPRVGDGEFAELVVRYKEVLDGCAAVVLSGSTAEGSWWARPPGPVAGNPTGAGDAVAAALAHGLILGRPWDERLRHAVAAGTASAMSPVAGEFSLADYTGLLPAVTVGAG